MELKDSIQMNGIFKIKSIYADGTFDEYIEKNLIMDPARTNMAQLIGGQTIGERGEAINKFVLGTKGHHGTDILEFIAVGDSEGLNTFDSTRLSLISEADPTAKNYKMIFNPAGAADVNDLAVSGKMYMGNTLLFTDGHYNTVNRLISNRSVTYTITIPATNANNDTNNSIIAYTEAALYAGDDIFSMKTFAGRVKENTVSLIVTWSLIF